jgi:hypothetical protein
MNQLKTGEVSEAAQAASDLEKELAEVLRQRAAVSAVLRAIANSPHDCSPYSTPSSKAREGSSELIWVSSVLSRKRAFVSLRVQ